MTNARNQGIFSVTDIFLLKFLINLPKIQKIHFFLMLIYIIIEKRNCRSETFSETNSGRNAAGNSPGGCCETGMFRKTGLFAGKMEQTVSLSGRKR